MKLKSLCLCFFAILGVQSCKESTTTVIPTTPSVTKLDCVSATFSAGSEAVTHSYLITDTPSNSGTAVFAITLGE